MDCETPDERTPLNDHYLTAEFHFDTDTRMGIYCNREWGYISKVDDGTQASQQGVEAASYIVRLNGEKYTEAAFNEAISKQESFTLQLRRTTNPDDKLKDVFYHNYKDYMMGYAWWSAVIFASIGAAIVFGTVISGEDKCPKRRLLECGVACIVSGVLLCIIEACARQYRQEPVSSFALLCVGVSISLSIFLILSTTSEFNKCGDGMLYMSLTFFGDMPLLEAVIVSIVSGDISIGLFIWYFFGKRAQMGIKFYMPG